MNNYREYLERLKKGEKGLNPFLDFLDIKRVSIVIENITGGENDSGHIPDLFIFPCRS